MTNNDKYVNALSKVQYDKKNFDTYTTKFKAALRMHPNKLDNVMLKGELNVLLKRQLVDSLEKNLKSDGTRVYTAAEVDARVAELLAECKAEVASAIILTIIEVDPGLAHSLEDKHDGKGDAMWAALAKKHTHAGNDTRQA